VKIREFKLEMDSTVDPSRIEEFEAIKDAWVNDNMSELQQRADAREERSRSRPRRARSW
jgi:hypothetical protein